jgi:hypothetical protein
MLGSSNVSNTGTFSMNEQTNSNLDTHLQDTLAWNRDGGVVFSSALQSLAPQGRYYVPFTDVMKVKISVIL